MVNVKFTDSKGRTWVKKFPRWTLAEIAKIAKRMNPSIRKIEIYRPKGKR